MTQKNAISGIKISLPLLAVRLYTDPATQDLTPRLVRLLTIARVNIAFLTVAVKTGASYALCCIDPDQRDKVAQLIDQDPELKISVHFEGIVGLLTLFPHGASLKTLGIAMQSLCDNNIRVHGLASSISALTFVIDYHLLENTAAILRDRLDPAPNPMPLRSEFMIRQEKLAR